MRLSIVLIAMMAAPMREDFPPTASVDLDLIREVADAMDENRGKFPFASIAFRFQEGLAGDFEEAKSGRLRDVHEAKCIYTYNGSHAIYEKKHSIASMAAKTSWSSVDSSTSTLESFRRLTNGKLTLVESIAASRDGKGEMYGHGIYPGVENFYQLTSFPLSLGYPEAMQRNDGHILRSILNGKPGLGIESVDTDAVLDGAKVIRISTRGPNGKATMWVDLERGAIPVLVRKEIDGSGSVEVYNGQIRNVAGHGWLPFEQTYFLWGRTARRTLIDQAEFDKPPGPEVFRMVTSRPVTIGNLAAGVSYKPQPFYDLDHLPSVSSGQTELMARVPANKDPVPQMPGERQPPPRYFTLVAIAVSVVLVSAITIRRIRR